MSSEQTITRIILVDDEELLRSGLALILDGAEGIEVVGQASNGRDAVPLIEHERPDVVLMDIRMPVMDGITAVETLAAHQPVGERTPIIMLTAFDTQDFVMRALRAGAVGFLLKTTQPQALVSAVKAAAAGQQILSPQVLQSLVKAQENAEAAPEEVPAQQARALDALSERESEIAQLIATGMSNGEIAAELFISPTTVKTHVKNIMGKLDAPSRIHIAIAVLEGR